jgi:hypothetical protein
MAENVVQLPADGVGSKLRTHTRTVGANTVHEQGFFHVADPTWIIQSGAVVPALNKQFLCFLNTGAQVFRLQALYIEESFTGTAFTGAGIQFDIKRITACSGGSTITPQILDSTDTAISGVTCLSAATSVTEGAVLRSAFLFNDELQSTVPVFVQNLRNYADFVTNGVKPIVFNQNEGLTVKCITSTTVGSFNVVAVVTKDA